MTPAVVLALALIQPMDPVAFGRREIMAAAGANAANVTISVKPAKLKEAYAIEGNGNKVTIIGTDPNGAMYGALEFAERVRNNGNSAWTLKANGKPFLADRGLNLFLTLPWNYEKNDTDFDPAALTDPDRWWFHNEDYWTTLLDLMARSRLNWLDIHGGWDVSVTNAPNLYAYFVTSPTFPKVGVSEEIKAKDLKQLNHIIDMAHARGIRVSLMAYEANLRIPQNPNPGYEATEANIYTYTREVVEQMIRRAPGLDAIGYRIGESGRSESFFHCYGEAVKNSGRDIPLVTRSWITRKQRVLPLARASKDFTVEIKYNGEQWGAPYMAAGGRMASWSSYSFEDYLSDSQGGKGKAEKMWPGYEAEGGGKWPDQPYKVVWQVRANGTHRIFPFYNPNWVRQSIQAMKVGTASGYTIEGEDAYYPKSPAYYLANPKDKYCDWIHQRDEMYWTTWGRLGYDPSTSDTVFDKQATRLLGGGSEPLVEAWKKASVLMPKAYMAYAIGPDHRDHAPELEWGGDAYAFLQGAGFDSTAFAPISEELANKATGGVDGRESAWWHAGRLISEAKQARELAAQYAGSGTGRVREIANSIRLDGALADYYASRFITAWSLGAAEARPGEPYLAEGTRLAAQQGIDAHDLLAKDLYYKPFTERLRMHTNTFTWADQHKLLVAGMAPILAMPEKIPPSDNILTPDPWAGAKPKLGWSVRGNEVVCTFQSSVNPDRAWLMVKPLPSSMFFHKVAMKRAVNGFEVSFPRERWGHVLAFEAEKGGKAARFPNALVERPYLIVPSQPGPTPQIYSSQEAMAYLDPKSLSPQKHGALIVGTRANDFFRFDNATKRKLLDPVERGMKLIILQEDFNKDRLDFLPKPLKFEGAGQDVFDPAGQLGLEKVEVKGIMYQRFLPSEGWDVFGNGGLARMKLGQGEVWVTSARLMQTMHIPSAAKAFVRMLSLGGTSKPTVLIDSCTEGGAFTSSCHQDLMNSHDIPFLMLGEVIAKEQGMNEYTPIAGKVADDDVLGGRGQQMLNAAFRGQVVQASKLPTPKTVAAFETERTRRRQELMRSLGLDPMPSKTPLNARITGVLKRDGYRIEKLVYESRPQFYVTAHVYVPEGPAGQKFPVVVHVNGHWAHKKAEDRLQLRSAFCALQGYIVITIDTPGWSFEGNSLIERRAEGDHNDFFLVEGGTNTTGYYVWDAMRGLDYMATRPDTDMTKIGLTGASGGGLATLYTFAADDRYKACVPVVYMSSMELAPDNGCLCNHVPATSQIGDRSDVIGIQAPKPVYIFGAQNDGEFPPDAMRLTQKKMAESWKLFGKESDAQVRVFEGPHDYNQLMREQMIGFFNKHLKGQGDGSPVPQPKIEIFDPEDHQVLVLDPPIAGERTMRDLSMEYLRTSLAMTRLANPPHNVEPKAAIALNGGVPKGGDLKYKETPTPDNPKKLVVTFESEPGVVTPAILILPNGKPTSVEIIADDQGKAAVATEKSLDGVARLYVDVLGTGELGEFEMRYLVYLGTSAPFKGGWQLARAAEAMKRYSTKISVQGTGPVAGQAAMWAGLLSPGLKVHAATGGLVEWTDVFKPGVSQYAVQPRAHLMGSLQWLLDQAQKK